MCIQSAHPQRKISDCRIIITCNNALQDASQEVVDSRRAIHGADLPRRGARLNSTASAAAHPLYAGQGLFSMYVHASPGFEGYSAGSLFHGREITPRVRSMHVQPSEWWPNAASGKPSMLC